MPERQPNLITGSLEAARAFSGFDYSAFAETQRRNFEAMLQANRVMAEGFRNLMQRQNEILRDAVTKTSDIMRDMARDEGDGRRPDPAELSRRALNTGFDYMRELSEMFVRTNAEAFAVLQERVRHQAQEAADQVQENARRGAEAVHSAAQEAAPGKDGENRPRGPRPQPRGETRIELGGQA